MRPHPAHPFALLALLVAGVLAACQEAPVPSKPPAISFGLEPSAGAPGDLEVQLAGYLDRLLGDRRTLGVGAGVAYVVVTVEADSGPVFHRLVEREDLAAPKPLATFHELPAGPATVVAEVFAPDRHLTGWTGARTDVAPGAVTVVDVLEQNATGSLTINATLLDGPVIHGEPPKDR